MIRLILILGLVVFFLPSLAGAGEVEECEIEAHGDGFIEVEYENDATGVECSAGIDPDPGVTPSAEDLQCVELCRAMLPEPAGPMCDTSGEEVQACLGANVGASSCFALLGPACRAVCEAAAIVATCFQASPSRVACAGCINSSGAAAECLCD